MKHLVIAAALAPAALGITTTVAFSAGETQPFSSPKANEQFLHESENLQAFVRVNKKRGTWCALQASLRLYIRDDSVFAGEQKELKTLLAELPGILRSQCNKIRASSIKAFIGTKPVYVASIKGINGKPIVAGRITNQRIVTKPGLFTNPLAVDFSACDASLVAGSFAAGESRVLPQLCDSHLRHERREEAAVEASGTATGDPAVA